jgi:AcrR family transcriptional regulator
LSIPSHKSSAKKTRGIQAPQRSNGKLRVAAILEAAAAVIAEKGYEGATMAEIAARSGTKIGSLYRFFPNKESVADTIVVSAREMALIFELFTRPAFMKLFDAGQEWSVKREEFRTAMLERTAKALMLHAPNLSKKSAENIATVILLNAKAVATHQALFNSSSSVPNEFRDMTRLYLQSRLGL